MRLIGLAMMTAAAIVLGAGEIREDDRRARP
jgi:hypothetical protein